jgi:hypothetical protein
VQYRGEGVGDRGAEDCGPAFAGDARHEPY